MVVAAVGCGPGPAGPCDGLPAMGCQGLDYAFTCINGQYQELHCQRDTVCSGGMCKKVICNVGDFSCDGSVAKICTADGTVEETDDCGPKGQVCVVEPLTAHCVAQVCTPMTTYCGGDEVRKCSVDGLKYDVVQTCDDPNGRGRTCVGSTCLDRCQLIEAHDRSTTGCHFLGVSGGMLTVLVGNVQPDLPATVTLSRSDGSLTSTQTVAPGTVSQLALGASTIGAGTALGLGIRVTSSVPVMVWLQPVGERGTLLHPNHVLSTSYVGVLGTSRETVLIIADGDSDVTVKVPVATDAGGTIPAVVAGGTLSQHLVAGQALALVASSGPLGGVRVDATAPVAMFVGDPSAASMPGLETLGRDFFTTRDGMMVSPGPNTVMTPAGMVTLLANQAVPASLSWRYSATAPLLMVQRGTVVPSNPQRRKTLFAPTSGVAVLAADVACTVTTNGGPVDLTMAGPGDFYNGPIGSGVLTSQQPLSGSTDVASGRQLSFGYGLDVLP